MILSLGSPQKGVALFPRFEWAAIGRERRLRSASIPGALGVGWACVAPSSRRGWALVAIVFTLHSVPEATRASSEDEASAQRGADPPQIHESIVVSATKSEETKQDIPTAATVLSADEIDLAPADDYGELLRIAPGLQVTEITNRDLNVSSRQATSSQANDLMVLHNGRSVYLDYIGFVMWDFIPSEKAEIERIEVIRGPTSAVWGANALTGVVNLITKDPGDLQGTTVSVGVGEGETYSASLVHGGMARGHAWKASGGYSHQGAYERPKGLIPGTATPYPDYPNRATSNPRLDLRLDLDDGAGTSWSFSAGGAGSGGISMTAIGPFEIDRSSWSGYGRVDAIRGAWSGTLYANILDALAPALLSVGPEGDPLDLTFDSRTLHFDLNHQAAFGDRHLVVWGGSARYLSFNLSVAADAADRREIGLFAQDEIALSRRWRWFLGARWEDVDPIGSRLSPRTSLLFSPSPRHTFRLGFHESYRNPTAINTEADTEILNQVLIPLPGGEESHLLGFESSVLGRPDLREEDLASWEIGYVGALGGLQLSAAAYRSELENFIRLVPTVFYGPDNPLPGWPFPPETIPPGAFPQEIAFANVGQVVNRGLELAANGRPAPAWSWLASYTWQDDPSVSGFPEGAVNRPPRHRATAGLYHDRPRWFGSLFIHYQDEAFWTDVLDSRFWGPTEAFTQVDVAVGTRLRDGKLRLMLQVTDLFDERIQQHVFGDIIGRTAVLSSRVYLGRSGQPRREGHASAASGRR